MQYGPFFTFLCFHYSDVPKLDEFNGLSDPFVDCYFREGKDGNDVKFHSTPVVNNVVSTKWDYPIPFDNYQSSKDQVGLRQKRLCPSGLVLFGMHKE